MRISINFLQLLFFTIKKERQEGNGPGLFENGNEHVHALSKMSDTRLEDEDQSQFGNTRNDRLAVGTTTSFDGSRLGRLALARRAMSDEDAQRSKRWSVRGEEHRLKQSLQHQQLPMMDPTQTLASLRRVQADGSTTAVLAKKSTQTNEKDEPTSTAMARHPRTPTKTPSLRKMGDKHALRALAAMAKRHATSPPAQIPALATRTSPANSEYSQDLRSREPNEEMSYLLHLSNLMEGRVVAPQENEPQSTTSSLTSVDHVRHVFNEAPRSSNGDVEHDKQPNKKRVEQTSFLATLFFLLLLVSTASWHVANRHGVLGRLIQRVEVQPLILQARTKWRIVYHESSAVWDSLGKEWDASALIGVNLQNSLYEAAATIIESVYARTTYRASTISDGTRENSDVGTWSRNNDNSHHPSSSIGIELVNSMTIQPTAEVEVETDDVCQEASMSISSIVNIKPLDPTDASVKIGEQEHNGDEGVISESKYCSKPEENVDSQLLGFDLVMLPESVSKINEIADVDTEEAMKSNTEVSDANPSYDEKIPTESWFLNGALIVVPEAVSDIIEETEIDTGEARRQKSGALQDGKGLNSSSYFSESVSDNFQDEDVDIEESVESTKEETESFGGHQEDSLTKSQLFYAPLTLPDLATSNDSELNSQYLGNTSQVLPDSMSDYFKDEGVDLKETVESTQEETESFDGQQEEIRTNSQLLDTSLTFPASVTAREAESHSRSLDITSPMLPDFMSDYTEEVGADIEEALEFEYEAESFDGQQGNSLMKVFLRGAALIISDSVPARESESHSRQEGEGSSSSRFLADVASSGLPDSMDDSTKENVIGNAIDTTEGVPSEARCTDSFAEHRLLAYHKSQFDATESNGLLGNDFVSPADSAVDPEKGKAGPEEGMLSEQGQRRDSPDFLMLLDSNVCMPDIKNQGVESVDAHQSVPFHYSEEEEGIADPPGIGVSAPLESIYPAENEVITKAGDSKLNQVVLSTVDEEIVNTSILLDNAEVTRLESLSLDIEQITSMHAGDDERIPHDPFTLLDYVDSTPKAKPNSLATIQLDFADPPNYSLDKETEDLLGFYVGGSKQHQKQVSKKIGPSRFWKSPQLHAPLAFSRRGLVSHHSRENESECFQLDMNPGQSVFLWNSETCCASILANEHALVAQPSLDDIFTPGSLFTTSFYEDGFEENAPLAEIVSEWWKNFRKRRRSRKADQVAIYY